MKTVKLISLLYAALALMAGCSKAGDPEKEEPIIETPQPNEPETQKDIPAVDNAILNFMKKYNIPGGSLAVSKNSKMVYQKGYGYADTEKKEEVTPEHIFRIASVSKAYTGVAILLLVQQNKLSLSDKVFGEGALLGTRYGNPPYNTNLSAITVRDLLLNISGSWGAATGGDVIDYNPELTNEQLLNWIIGTRPNPRRPGEVFDYSNINYWIAGRIIEKASGKSYIDFVKENILKPIGAEHSGLAGKTLADRNPKEVKYYGQETDQPYVYNISFPRRDADGGITATAPDLLRFVNAIDGLTARPDILNSTSRTLLAATSPVYANYGLGIGVWKEHNLIYSYGSLPGTRAGFMCDNANGMSVTLLFNSRIITEKEQSFVYEMQDVLLGLLKNNTGQWQNIDQFAKLRG